VIVLTVLWSICLLFSVIGVIVTLKDLRNFYLFYSHQSDESSRCRVFLGMFLHDRFRMAFLIFVFHICFAGLWSLKLVHPTRFVIGRNLISTVLFGVGGTVFWTSSYLYSKIILKFAHLQAKVNSFGYKDSTVIRIRKVRRVLGLIPILSAALFFLPILTFVNPSTSTLVGRIHFGGTGAILMLFGAIAMPYAVNLMCRDLSSYLASQAVPESNRSTLKILKLLGRFKVAKVYLIVNGLFLGLVSLAYAVWPFFTRRIAYQLPVSWAAGHLAALLVVWSIRPDRTWNKKLRESRLPKTLASMELQYSTFGTEAH